jgi:aerobic-type carbon monoxide dehydrogenase small subunit (CoxS/CutS family)
MTTETFTITVNKQARTVTTSPQQPLLETLREQIGLTGTKYGCGEGQCGACTVLVDGKPVASCQTAIQAVGNKAIVTIEGLATGDKLHAVQQAFLEEGAFQCGYCTAGMILATVALLTENPNPSDEQIKEGMNGHICRCCGYASQMRAIRRAAGRGGS